MGALGAGVCLAYFPGGEHTNWLKLDLDGYQGTPMAGVPYTLHFTDGRKKSGILDSNGFAEEKTMPEVVDKVVYHNAPGVSDPERSAASALLGSLDAHLAEESQRTEPPAGRKDKQ